MTTVSSPSSPPSLDDNKDVEEATTARPSLARSEHGATQKQGGNKNNNSATTNDNNDNDLLLMTAHDINHGMQEVSVQTALQKCRQVSKSNDDSNNNTKQRQAQFWIHVQVTAADLAAALPVLDAQLWQPLDLQSSFLHRVLLDPVQWQTPQVVPLHQAAWIVMRVLGASPIITTTSSAAHHSTIRHVAAICLPHVLVTVTLSSSNKNKNSTTRQHKGQSAPTAAPVVVKENTNRKSLSLWQDARLYHQYHRDESLSRILQEREVPQASVTGCLVLWLGYHVSHTQAAGSALRNRVYEMVQQQQHHDDDDDDVNQILSSHEGIATAKDTLLRLSAVAEEQAEGIQAVLQGDAVTAGWTLNKSHAVQGSLQVVAQAAASTERMLTRLEKRVADLEHAYDAAQQSKINRRLQVLTILSAVFLPLTLMAGVWGMNFTHMPELQRDNAYYFALSSMAAVAVSLIFFFWRNGWWN